MRDFAKVSPQFWISASGKQRRQMGLSTQLVAIYLLTNPHSNMLGIYYLPLAFIAHEIGLTSEEVDEALNNLIQLNFCTYDSNTEYVWVHDMAFEQLSPSLKLSDHRVKNIKDLVNSLPELPFLNLFIGKYGTAYHIFNSDSTLEDPSRSLRSKEKEIENEKEKEKKKEIIMSGKPDDVNVNHFVFDKNKNEQMLFKSQAIEVLNFLNEKTKHQYRLEDDNLKLVIKKLQSGVTVDDCRAVIARKCRDWSGTEMQKYLRPATLFNPVKFEQYLGECVVEDVTSDSKDQEGLMDEFK